MSSENQFRQQVKGLYYKLMIAFVLIGSILFGFIYLALNPTVFDKKPKESDMVDIPVEENKIENGIHVATGFAEGEGLTEVIQNCTNCHSALLVTQNRMTREGWEATIRWMQETQNLWDLGDQEEAILNYLATHYAPQQKGRREPLTNVDWYTLDQ